MDYGGKGGGEEGGEEMRERSSYLLFFFFFYFVSRVATFQPMRVSGVPPPFYFTLKNLMTRIQKNGGNVSLTSRDL